MARSRVLDGLARALLGRLLPVGASFQHQLVGGKRRRHRPLADRAGARQRRDQRGGDARRDVGLDVDDVHRLAIVAVAPELGLGGGLDQLHGDAQLIAKPPDAAFEHVVDAQFRADLADVLPGPLVEHRRRSRDDAELRRLQGAEFRNHLLGEAVAQVFLLGVTAEILEWQDRQRHLPGRHVGQGISPPDRHRHARDREQQYQGDGDEGRPPPPRCARRRSRRKGGGRRGDVDARRRHGRDGRGEGLVDRQDIHWRDEAIPLAGDGLDEPGIVGRVPEDLAEPVDRRVHAVVEIDEGVGRPQSAAQILARHQFAGTFEEDHQNVERAPAQPDAQAVLAHLAAALVHFEHAEAVPTRNAVGRGHSGDCVRRLSRDGRF